MKEILGSQAMPEPSLHEIKQKSNVAGWESVRTALCNVAVEGSSMPIGQQCILCSTLAEYRCTECAAWAFYCSDCFGSVHSKVGIFHTGEVWQVTIAVDCLNTCTLPNIYIH